jgi:pimeloyl-ACP methyl ester carboxylesterase
MTAQKVTAQELAASGSLYVGESGTPRSPAIVFLHGVGNSGGMWAKHMAGLGGYHCLAPRSPGVRSEQPAALEIADRHRGPGRRAHRVPHPFPEGAYRLWWHFLMNLGATRWR